MWTETQLIHHADKPAVGVTLMMAGLVPIWFDSPHLSAVYYALLIIPAAGHALAWIYSTAIPYFIKIHNKTKSLWTKIQNYF